MNFITFQEQRQALLAAPPELLDCAETNLYRSLSHLIPASPPPPTGTIHRCHLASQWTALYDLPAEWSKRALISNGVRDSLARLFSHYAKKGTQLWIPEDNYPVYHELATAAGLRPKTFPTLPDIQWPGEAPSLQDEVLLITHPLKPRNRPLESEDAEALIAWLHANPRRRLLLDVVYTLEARFDKITRRLLETEQTLLLHSLTKGWLYPRLFGIALVPEADAEELQPTFRDSPPSQAHLNTARNLMTAHPDTPRRVAQALEAAQRHLFSALSALPALAQEPLPTHGVGYFFPIQMPWQDLLKHNVLGLPATTFGSTREDITLLSSLSFIS